MNCFNRKHFFPEFLLIPVFCIIGGVTSFLFPGCGQSSAEMYSDIARNSPQTWSVGDSFGLIVTSMSNNYRDPRQVTVKANATAYFPMTIMAIQREAQLKNHWTDDKFRDESDQLLQQSLGMYYEWNTRRFVDASGNYVQSPRQYTVLEFLVTITNTQSCIAPLINAPSGTYFRLAPILSMSDMPCHDYDIRDLRDRILLKNDRGDEVRPFYVWGRMHDQLLSTETLFIKFPLVKPDGKHILDKCSVLCLEITGFDEGPILLTFPVDESRLPAARIW